MTQPEPAADPQTLRKNRLQLIVILVIAALSLGGSYFLFFQARDGAVWGTTNQGEWVRPALTAAQLSLVDDAGVAVAAEALWGVWVVATPTCDVTCAQAVHEMRQLHILLGKDADRVRRSLVSPDMAATALAEPFPKLARWRQLGGVELNPGIYIVDPLGNLVFRYPLDTAGKPVLSDLKRLLKVSQIG